MCGMDGGGTWGDVRMQDGPGVYVVWEDRVG